MLKKEDVLKNCKTKEDLKYKISILVDMYNNLLNECCVKINIDNKKDLSKEQLYKKLFIELLRRYYEFTTEADIFYHLNQGDGDLDLVCETIDNSRIEKFTTPFFFNFKTIDIEEENVEINGEIHNKVIVGHKCLYINDIDETLNKLDLNKLFEEDKS